MLVEKPPCQKTAPITPLISFKGPKPVATPDVCMYDGTPILVDNSLMAMPPNEVEAVKEQYHHRTVDSKVLVKGFQYDGVYEYPENVR